MIWNLWPIGHWRQQLTLPNTCSCCHTCIHPVIGVHCTCHKDWHLAQHRGTAASADDVSRLSADDMVILEQPQAKD